MHRIDPPGATPDNRFTEGDPTIPTAATEVSAEWLTAVQEEVAAVIAGAGIVLDKADNGQLLEAIATLIANAAPEMPGYATTETPGLVRRATDEDTEAGVGDGYISPPQLAELLGRVSVTASVRDMLAGGIVEWESETIPTLADGLPLGLELAGDVVALAMFPRLLRKWCGEAKNATAPAWYRCTGAGVRNAAGGYIRMQDRRGEFPRGWDHGRGVDAGRGLGSAQGQSMPQHKHQLPFGFDESRGGYLRVQATNPFGRGAAFTPTNQNSQLAGDTTQDNWELSDNPYSPSVSGENRTRNIATMYIVLV
ncbi:phage tail protein [Nitratidesulfovibrio sp. D1]|uniref:phage tail protein n=1 Tax=Nitratidesulfovibrio sp. D1 TaxID=3440151 RepID=UPI003EB9DAC4